uniref:NADH-ubiquinone oxidoreductase chain 2 n=1 Tax=Anoeconeossa unicornuta TaxID=2218011 RepID=A0A344A240_9HEMI|nr:NADH dehydrogenase subunit 2 [Anoeconeossa unicornuta]AWU48831.1 NADH dehydrogenase subunit 2 [Anoeconeossa unicornuta]
MKNINLILFFPVFLISVILPLSASSWLLIWIGLEMNLITFLYLSLMFKNMFTSESSMKYFLIQAVGSMVLLISFSVSLITYEEWASPISLFPPLALMLKSGMAPVHGWVPEIVSKLPSLNILFFFTFQKLNPLLICFSSWSYFMIWVLIFNVVVGAIGGLGESSLFKLLVYSSINNMGWMLLCMIESLSLFFIYFIVYSLLNLMIMSVVKFKNTKWLLQLKSYSSLEKLFIYVNFLSLSGLPPLLGFFSKWLVIYFLSQNLVILVSLSIFFSVITLFYYLKSVISSMTCYNYSSKWMLKGTYTYNISVLIFTNLIGVFLLNVIF